MATGRAAAAEPSLKAVAAAGDAPAAKLTLAQYVMANRRRARQCWESTSVAFLQDTVRWPPSVLSTVAQARTRVREVLSKYPKNVPAHLLTGACCSWIKRDEALASVNTALAADQFRAGLFSGRTNPRSDDRTEEAIGAYEKVLSLDPRPFAAELELARLYLIAGEMDKSLASTRQALSMQPQSAEAHNLLVRDYLASGDLNKANAELTMLEKAFPHSAGVFNLMALAQLASHQVDLAHRSYERAIDASPMDLEALDGLTRIDVMNGHAKEATARMDGRQSRRKPSVDLLTSWLAAPMPCRRF